MNAGNFVLSSLLNNTNLLYNSAYPLSKDDFKPNLSHKIIYISICQLADKGCSVIDAKELVTYLEGGYEEQLNALKADLSDGNVIEYIDTLKALDNDKSYTYWYNEVRKRSLLRQYRDSGFDISEFWDENKNEEKNNSYFDFLYCTSNFNFICIV
jgi:replicative DNA helicase